MMTLADLLDALEQAKIRLLRSDDNLCLRGRVKSLPPEVVGAAKAYKATLLPLLNREEAQPLRLLSSLKEVSRHPKSPDSGKRPAVVYRLVMDADSLTQVANAVRCSQHIALDTETTGLDPCKDRVRLLQLATDSGVYIIDCFAVDPSGLWPALAGKKVVFHNAHFDALFLHSLGFDFSTVTIRDTLILSVLLTAGDRSQRNTLAAVAERYLGYSLDKTHQKSDWSGELTPDMLAYAAQDPLATRDVYEPLQVNIEAAHLRGVADLEHRCLPAVLWMSTAGVGFDREGWLQLAEKAEKEATALGQKLEKLAPPKPPPKKPTKTDGPDWNWNSDKQVKKMFDLLGFSLESTSVEALAGVDHPVADMLRRYRAAAKLAKTYGRNWLDFIGADGRIRCNWKQMEAITGRMACEQPNMQNLPKDPAYRKCFIAPPGRVLIKADYSQIELRIAAKVAKDKAMIDAFICGQDLHRLTAQQLTGREAITSKERSLAKPVNFGLIYGLSAPALARKAKLEYQTDLNKEQAEQYRAAWFKAWPGIAYWHKELERQRWLQMLGRESAETRTLTGRRTLIEKGLWYGARANYVVQGTGGDGIKAALALLWERRERCPGAFPVLAVHDEIVVEADRDTAEQAEKWLTDAMVDGMAPLIHPVPCVVEPKIGRTWGA
jgi:DNA polymerase I-like protein with 3'-5' exonuclease and polymerase domains